MNNLFAFFYEKICSVYAPEFSLIFSSLYEEHGYDKIILTVFILPAVIWMVFYFIWNNPYLRIYHWVIFLIISMLSVFFVTLFVASDSIFNSINAGLLEALATPLSGYQKYAHSIIPWYATINCFLAAFTSLILSIIFKQFSKINKHLPI